LIILGIDPGSKFCGYGILEVEKRKIIAAGCDGKDGDGDRIANGTYFYKIKAKQLGNSEVTEKIGKLIILK